MAEARISNTMLSNSGENEHPCCVPDLRGKALSFSPLRMILTTGLSYISNMVTYFMMVSYLPFIPTFLMGLLRKDAGGAWVAQSVKNLTSA